MLYRMTVSDARNAAETTQARLLRASIRGLFGLTVVVGFSLLLGYYPALLVAALLIAAGGMFYRAWVGR